MKDKTARINIRITEELKNEFDAVCKNNMQTPSLVIRNLIEDFIKNNEEDVEMLKLKVMDHGVTTELFEGTLEEVVEYLKENESLYDWILNEDAEAEQPELKNIETLRDLEYELKKIDHDWWTLEVK